MSCEWNAGASFQWEYWGRFNLTTYYGFLQVGNNWYISKNGSYPVGPTAPFTWAAGDTEFVHFKIVGSQIDLYAWKSGSSEPGTPTLSLTDSGIASGGYCRILTSNSTGSATTDLRFDDLIVQDPAASTPAAIPQLQPILNRRRV
jgi:hypothetical protein